MVIKISTGNYILLEQIFNSQLTILNTTAYYMSTCKNIKNSIIYYKRLAYLRLFFNLLTLWFNLFLIFTI